MSSRVGIRRGFFPPGSKEFLPAGNVGRTQSGLGASSLSLGLPPSAMSPFGATAESASRIPDPVLQLPVIADDGKVPRFSRGGYNLHDKIIGRESPGVPYLDLAEKLDRPGRVVRRTIKDQDHGNSLPPRQVEQELPDTSPGPLAGFKRVHQVISVDDDRHSMTVPAPPIFRKSTPTGQVNPAWKTSRSQSSRCTFFLNDFSRERLILKVLRACFRASGNLVFFREGTSLRASARSLTKSFRHSLLLSSLLRCRDEDILRIPSFEIFPDNRSKILCRSSSASAELRVTSKHRVALVSSLLTFCPPGPGERENSHRISFSSISSRSLTRSMPHHTPDRRIPAVLTSLLNSPIHRKYESYRNAWIRPVKPAAKRTSRPAGHGRRPSTNRS